MGKFSDSLISGLGSGIVGAGLGLIGSIGAGNRQEKAIEAQKEPIVTGKQIGRASCRDRV